MFFVIIAIVLVVFASGCGKKEGQPTRTYQHQGTQGVVINFVPNQPPSVVYTGDNFDVALEVRNKGANDVSNVYLFLSGFDPNLVSGLKERETINSIEGSSQYNPEGGYDIISFARSNYASAALQQGMDYYRPTFIATACYTYSTVATPVVCIDPNPYKSGQKACTIGNIAMAGGQGAPIAITSVEEEASPSKVMFKIHISNVGGGEVINTELSQCGQPLDYTKLDVIKSYSVTLGNMSGECKPDQLRLINGQATIYCKFQIPSNAVNAYTTPLRIELFYDYKSTISKTIEIRNIVE